MYEVFQDDGGKIFETGNVIFADLILRNQKNTLYYLIKKIVQVITIKMARVLKKL